MLLRHICSLLQIVIFKLVVLVFKLIYLPGSKLLSVLCAEHNICIILKKQYLIYVIVKGQLTFLFHCLVI